MDPRSYIDINKDSWNKRLETHLNSSFYNMDGFLEGENSLNDIELALLGDVKGKSILHLQCHFGQDSLSLARMGAQVVGVDLSDRSIEKARSLNKELGLSAEFITCNIYDLPDHLNTEFDIVFTSYGTIIWLPDLDRWAGVISRFLKPSGTFVMADFHPVVWIFDDDFKSVKYNYFNTGRIAETESSTYADSEKEIELDIVTWNHSMSELFTALMSKNLMLSDFREYDYSPYDCFQNMVKISDSKFRIERMGNKLPMVYALKAKCIDH